MSAERRRLRLRARPRSGDHSISADKADRRRADVTRSKRRISVAFALAAATAVALVSPASAAPRLELVLDGLSSPKGVAATSDLAIVGQGAFGPPGPVLGVDAAGNVVTVFGKPMSLIDIAVSPLDESIWALGNDQVLYHQKGDHLARVRDIAVYQKGDPDPSDTEGNPTETNPYGLTVLPNGDALVADAANNDLLRVRPNGAAGTVARFDVEMVSTDHLGGGFPPQIPAEAVPTTVAIGPDGWAYVGELKGFPFRPGSSRIWRVNPNARGALCSVNVASPSCSSFASGLTAIQDIDFAPTGAAWIYELARGGVLAFEAGFESGDFPPAVLLSATGPGLGQRREVARGAFSEPGGVIVDPAGWLFVTDGIFSEGRLLRILP
jgi:hypothetical protein